MYTSVYVSLLRLANIRAEVLLDRTDGSMDELEQLSEVCVSMHIILTLLPNVLQTTCARR